MGKLNTKIKFLIIAVYTLLLFLLVFVLFSPKAIDLYEKRSVFTIINDGKITSFIRERD